MRKTYRNRGGLAPVREQILVERNAILCCATPYGVEYGCGDTFFYQYAMPNGIGFRCKTLLYVNNNKAFSLNLMTLGASLWRLAPPKGQNILA